MNAIDWTPAPKIAAALAAVAVIAAAVVISGAVGLDIVDSAQTGITVIVAALVPVVVGYLRPDAVADANARDVNDGLYAVPADQRVDYDDPSEYGEPATLDLPTDTDPDEVA